MAPILALRRKVVNEVHVPRKDIVKVVLSRQRQEILKQIATKLGQSESEIMRTAFMQYAKELSLITEKVHGKN